MAVVLQVCRFEKRPPCPELAVALSLSISEVHQAVVRANAARLLHGPELGRRANRAAVREFLLHGVKYAFPANRGELTRGAPTAYAAEPLKSRLTPDDEPPPVWPYAEGAARGVSFEPLYKQAPKAALKNPECTRCLPW